MNRPTPSMLVVLHAFGRYGRGDMIVDPVAIRAVLDGGNTALVVIPAPLVAIPAPLVATPAPIVATATPNPTVEH